MTSAVETTEVTRLQRTTLGPSSSLLAPVDASAKACLTGDPWWFYSKPFPHVVATNVFVPAVQKALEAAYETVGKIEGLGWARPDFSGFTITAFGDRHKAMFPVFLSPEWLQLFARLVGMGVTNDVDGGLHHHTVGSSSGWVHNDNNPGWFEPRNDGEVNFCDRSRWNYKTGEVLAPGAKPVMRVRAASMIYFLGNGDWKEGDGGETGLYEHAHQPVLQPSKRIPPIDNSLLLFACSPYSWHAFLSNIRKPRRTVILFLHQEAAAFEARWGRNSLVRWN